MAKTKTTILTTSKPTLAESQRIVGGLIQIAYDDGKTQIICNDEGKINGLPINIEATTLWADKLGIERVEDMYDCLVGDVLVLHGKAMLD